MVKLVRHRQTKGAATDRQNLTPPRHISTLPVGLQTPISVCPWCNINDRLSDNGSPIKSITAILSNCYRLSLKDRPVILNEVVPSGCSRSVLNQCVLILN